MLREMCFSVVVLRNLVFPESREKLVKALEPRSTRMELLYNENWKHYDEHVEAE